MVEVLVVQSRRAKAARFAVGAIFFMNGAMIANWNARLPAVEAERGLNHATLGLALLVIGLGALVAMPLGGWCSLRFGSHRVTRVAAALHCAGLPLIMFAPDAATFILALLGFGMASGALDVAMNTQAITVEQRYGRPINSSFHALFSLGGLAGAAAGALVAAAKIAPLPHFLGAAILLGGAAGVVAFPRLLSHQVTPPPAPLGARESRPSLFRLPRRLLMLGAVAFCVMMGEGAMGDWSAIFLRRSLGASEGTAAAGYAVFSITMAIGRLGGDRLAASLGPVALVRISGAIAAGGLALALIAGTPAAALAGFAIVGLGFASVVPQVFTAAGRTSGVASGAALAATTTIGYFGFLVGPPLIGFAAELAGLRLALGIVVAMSLVIAVLAPCLRLPSTDNARP